MDTLGHFAMVCCIISIFVWVKIDALFIDWIKLSSSYFVWRPLFFIPPNMTNCQRGILFNGVPVGGQPAAFVTLSLLATFFISFSFFKGKTPVKHNTIFFHVAGIFAIPARQFSSLGSCSYLKWAVEDVASTDRAFQCTINYYFSWQAPCPNI